jgi:hypothetical protein
MELYVGVPTWSKCKRLDREFFWEGGLAHTKVPPALIIRGGLKQIGVTVHELMVTDVQSASCREVTSRMRRVDPIGARNIAGSGSDDWVVRRGGNRPRLGPIPDCQADVAPHRTRSRRTRVARTLTATEAPTGGLPPSRLTVPAIRPAVGARQTGPDRTGWRKDGDCSIGIRWVSVPVRLRPLGTYVSGHVVCRRHPPIDHRGITSRPRISQVI